jgi:hypothetical protein
LQRPARRVIHFLARNDRFGTETGEKLIFARLAGCGDDIETELG